jgi:HPt (histidine-containing phosphotransfer) domain-containing protein
MPAPDAAATRAMLAALWERTLPATQAKLTVLQRAAEAAESGALMPELCRQAAGDAHKLAGSLGMFGYPNGTEIARDIEQHLDGCADPSAADAEWLRVKVNALRVELGL